MPTVSQRDTPTSANSYRFPMVSAAADVAAFTVHPEQGLQIALVKRSDSSDAFPGYWALPGGFLRADRDKTIEDCARREFMEETQVRANHLELVGVYSDIGRDPRPERILSVAFLAVIPQHSLRLAPVKGTDVSAARWLAWDKIDSVALAFDHRTIAEAARQKLNDHLAFGKPDETFPEVLFAFMPERFTIARAEFITSSIKGFEPDRANFRKWVERFAEATDEMEPGRTRPAHLYKRKDRNDKGVETNGPPLALHLSELISTAKLHKVDRFSFIIPTLAKAPPEASAFLGEVLALYGSNDKFFVNVTRVPDIRIVDKRTERVLVRLQWQVRRKDFACTCLAEPERLESTGLEDLRRWTSGPHKSGFRLQLDRKDLERLEIAVQENAALFRH